MSQKFAIWLKTFESIDTSARVAMRNDVIVVEMTSRMDVQL